MIENKNENFVKMAGVLETKDFQIKADDGKMFHILSNLYSNPLGAVVRELSTNCCDGHKIAGNEKLPFDIILPGKFDTNYFITFRDYGPGMPDKVIQTIFTTFGQSTKTDSNLETGCLGLGSKSPLAISDSFTITSVNDGVKSTYSVSKDEQRKPVLAKFGEFSTEEENGLIVTVPLTKEHQQLVLSEIKDQLKHFRIKPNVTRGDKILEVFEETKYYKLKNFNLLSRTLTYNANNEVIQGEVGYSFSSSTFLKSFIIDDSINMQRNGMHITSESKNIIDFIFNHYYLNIFMPMGTVSFAPSREELIYDNSTCKNIFDELMILHNLLIDKIENEHSKFSNNYQYFLMKRNNDKSFGGTDVDTVFFKKCGFYYEKYLNNTRQIFSCEEYDNNSKFSHILELKTVYQDYSSITTKSIIKKDRYLNRRTAVSFSRFFISEFSRVVYDNMIKITLIKKSDKQNLKYSKIYTEYMTESVKNFKLIIVKVEDVNSDFDILDFIKHQGLEESNFVSYSEVLKRSKEYIESGKVDKTVMYRPQRIRQTTLNNMNRSANNWELIDATANDIKNNLTGVYIPTIRNTFVFKGSFDNIPFLRKLLNKANYSDILYFLISFGIESDSNSIYNTKIYSGNEKYFKNTNLIHIEDFLISLIEKIKFVNAWHALNKETKTFNIINCRPYDIQRFMQNIDFFQNNKLPKNADNKFKELLKIKDYRLKSLIDMLGEDHPLLKKYQDMKKLNIDLDINSKYKSAIYDLNCSDEILNNLCEMLDIKITWHDFNDIEELLYYHNASYFLHFNITTTTFRKSEELFEDYKNAIIQIKTRDFMIKNLPNIEDQIEISVPENIDELENDSTITKHDYINDGTD